ncbi:MAG: PH domain-containing protein [Tangfeifania sp.]
MSSIDLSKPTRQSPRGLILIFLFSAQKFIRAFWPVLLVLVFQNEIFRNNRTIFIAVLVFLILLIIHSILYYLNFYFYLEDDEFILKKGYLRKQTLSIPFDRIQSVNTKQNLIQQLLNVVTLEIDTAGTAAKELKIHALDSSVSSEIQEQLQAVKKSDQTTEEPQTQQPETEKEKLLLQLTPADLLKIGISQNHIRAGLIILAFGLQIFNQIQDVFEEKAEQYSSEFIEFISNSNSALLTFLVVFFLLVSILFSLFRTVFKYFDFKLLKKEKSYRIESGLFNKRKVVIPHQKVQELNWETGPLKKIFGIYHLVFKQAVSGQNRSQQQLVDAPGCLTRHLEKLKSDLFGEDRLSEMPRIYSDNFYFRRLWLLFGWIPVLLATPFFYSEWIFWISAPIWLLGSAGYSYLIIKKRYFRMNNNQIRISKGAISHKWEQMELHKIQAVEFRQSIFQKRRKLASLELMNASGTITIPYINEKVAKKIYNYLLYHTEISGKNWM